MKYLLLLLFITNGFCFAQIPPGYYNAAQGLTGNNLKIALHGIIDNHTEISYDALWNAYKKTDKKPNGKVWDMYSDIPAGTPPYQYTFVTNQCGSYGVEGDCYNREHSWPQSWFNSLTGPVSDLFHIYPTDGKVNGERSNYPYGNVGVASWTSLNGSKLGPCTDAGYNQTAFEPIDEYKGDLARTYFYMSTRYYSEDAGWSASAATNKSDILQWEINVLLQWNHQDTVSAKEIARNDSIYYLFQHNRNPFIDNPQWADSIWQSTVSIADNEFVREHSFSIYPNPATDFLFIENMDFSRPVTFLLFNSTGQIISKGIMEDNKIDLKKLVGGVYFIQVQTDNGNAVRSFIKQ